MSITQSVLCRSPEVDEVCPRRETRRSLLRLLSRCLVVVALPITYLPNTLASPRKVTSSEVAQERASGRRPRIQWSASMDRDLITRWMTFQSQPLIAREMGVPKRAVRVRATRLGLPARPRESIVWS